VKQAIQPNKAAAAFAVIAASATLYSGSCRAASELNYAELLKTRPPRDVIWTFDASMIQYNLKAPDDSKISGMAGSFVIGYGRVRGDSWASGRIHFLAGPWDMTRNASFDADYSGTAIDVEYGAAIPGTSLRSGSSPFWAVAAGYMDLNGRNIGANRKNNGDPNDPKNFYLEQDFKTNFGALTLTPAIGWQWARADRPSGNEPELLATRIESAFVRLGAMIPVYSRARVEVIKRDQTDALSQSPSQHTTTGTMRGYSLIASTGVWLGI
jgi:hypothetical protein